MGNREITISSSYIYIYAFSRRFYPKRLTIAFRLYIFISMCVPWESNPQPFALLTQCSTTEPHRNTLATHDNQSCCSICPVGKGLGCVSVYLHCSYSIHLSHMVFISLQPVMSRLNTIFKSSDERSDSMCQRVRLNLVITKK